LSSRNDLTVVIALVTLISVTVFSIGKSWLRLMAVRLVLNNYGRELREQVIPQFFLCFITPALFFYNCVQALVSKRMTWRGTTYEMISANKTRIIN
jgi:hypothetical protein